MTVLDEIPDTHLSPTFLVFIIIHSLFGLLTNSYSAIDIRKNFELSKMMYKTLFWCCLINVIGFIVLLITSLYLINGSESKLVCTVFQVSLQYPLFIVQSFLLLISVLRCINSCSKKDAEKLISFQKKLVTSITPLPFACLGTFYIYRMSNEKPLNFGHLVSCKVNIFAELVRIFLIYIQGRKWLPKTGWASGNAACHCRRAAAWRHLLFCQNLGGQLHTLPTCHLHP